MGNTSTIKNSRLITWFTEGKILSVNIDYNNEGKDDGNILKINIQHLGGYTQEYMYKGMENSELKKDEVISFFYISNEEKRCDEIIEVI
jgi:hypothetical protein